MVASSSIDSAPASPNAVGHGNNAALDARSLRLGLVGPLPPPAGGMAMQTLQLARLLKEQGVTVDLIQSNAPYSPAVVANLWGLRALFRLLPYLWRVWRLAGRVQVIHLMANSGWSWQLFAAPVVWLGRLRGTPVIVNYRGGEAADYLRTSARWVKPTIARAACLAVPSGFLRQVFRDFGVEARIIPNVIDLNVFRPPPRRDSHDTFTVVVTRNLEPIYALDTALHALAIARESRRGIRLQIAGSGPQRAELEELARDLGVADAVSFLGRLDRTEIVELYWSADAALNPSRVDNMPNSILEALACGVPVVSTNVGGVSFIVEHGRTALLVDRDDAQAMAAAILQLCADPQLQSTLRARGLEEVQHYAWEQVRPLWLQLYREVGAAV